MRYERTVRYLEEMLQSQYNLKDIPLKELNHEFVLNFEHFVKVQKSCAQNAAVKYLKNLKKITRLALVNKWIADDPFTEIRFHQTQSNRDFLTEEELNAIINKKVDIPRLETVRDIFVFCALSGLAFTDAQHLTPEHITQDSNGDYWIRKPREKTNNMCNIPLLDIPRMIAEKYKNHPECIKKGVVLPVPSNQRMNSYLKEIADVCGIKKALSTHIARHTFCHYYYIVIYPIVIQPVMISIFKKGNDLATCYLPLFSQFYIISNNRYKSRTNIPYNKITDL